MRAPILSMFSAAVALLALPAAVNAEPTGAARLCPLTCPAGHQQVRVIRHVVVRRVVVVRHARHGRVRHPIVQARMQHHRYERFAYRSERDESRVDFGHWMMRRREWSDRDGWTTFPPSGGDWDRAEADRYGRHMMFEEHCMPCRGGWHGEYGWSTARPSATDRYGYLTWPGKTHIWRDPPAGLAPDVIPDTGPNVPSEGPPEGPWQVHP